ncbi:MAG: SLBB domain-containing protein [Gemmatimonadaceae bacterium]
MISGEVYEPGVYHWKRGMTIGKLLEMAQGPLPWGLTDRVKVFRPVEPTGRTKIIDLDLTDSSSKWTRLSEFDSVVVLDGRLLFPSGTILVGGAVNEPGQHDFVEGQTLRDVIDLSGGLREDAYQVEVAREVRKTEFSDTSSIVRRFDIDSEFIKKTARLFRVERGDVVSVHAKPGYREPATVSLEGEFYLPGRYALQTSNERLASVIRRAGGILPTADSEAFRLIRSGRAVAVNLPKALVGDERDNIVLQPGDLLRVTRGTGTVQISGAVQREVLVPYNPSWSLDDYLAAAGGLARRADDDAIVVEYASGEVARRHRWLGITVSKPQIRTGATITVGTKEPSTDKWKDALTVASQAASLLASLVVAWSVARK